MMPGDALGSQAPAAFAFPQRARRQPLRDTERGGTAIGDTSQGLSVRQWHAEYRAPDVVMWADGVPEAVVLSRPGLTEIALAFDQNMNPFIAFMDAGGLAWWYYNSLTAQMEVSPYAPAGSHSPRATLDDNRDLAGGWSDIILAYVRDGALYYRQQRDRYATERLLHPDIGENTLATVGMGTGLRLQFQLCGGEPVTYEPPAI